MHEHRQPEGGTRPINPWTTLQQPEEKAMSGRRQAGAMASTMDPYRYLSVTVPVSSIGRLLDCTVR